MENAIDLNPRASVVPTPIELRRRAATSSFDAVREPPPRRFGTVVVFVFVAPGGGGGNGPMLVWRDAVRRLLVLALESVSAPLLLSLPAPSRLKLVSGGVEVFRACSLMCDVVAAAPLAALLDVRTTPAALDSITLPSAFTCFVRPSTYAVIVAPSGLV